MVSRGCIGGCIANKLNRSSRRGWQLVATLPQIGLAAHPVYSDETIHTPEEILRHVHPPD